MANVTLTNITPPRVPMTDQRTGLISREWYRFFLNLFELTGSGQNTASLKDLQLGPPSLTVDQINEVVSNATDNLSPSQDALLAQLAELQKQIDSLQKQIQCPCTELTAELEKQIQGLQVQPIVDVNAIIAAIGAASSSPVTKTADFTVDDNEAWIINNKSGSTCTVTLPVASAWTGREITFKNLQAQTLVSASSNVVLIDSASAGTAILLAVVGNWATMVSDGTNWVIMQQAVNNCLLLE
jgi:hypothetical protein